MLIDVTYVFQDYENEPIKVPSNRCPACGRADSGEGEPFTLKTVLVNILSAGKEGEKLQAMQRIARSELARKIFTQDAVEMTPKQLSELQELLEASTYTPLIFEQAYKILEGREPFSEGQE